MLKNYIVVAIRNLLRHKVNSLINISGLAIGMACCILIFLFVQHETSFDKFHKNADRIYRVVAEFNNEGKPDNFANTPAPLGPALPEEFPEVINTVRMSYWGAVLLVNEDKYFYNYRCMYADQSIFDVFSFTLLKGNPKTALKDPDNIVITERIAKTCFQDENPIGKMFTVSGNANKIYQVVGVLRDPQSNSQLQFDYLLPFSNVSSTNWGGWNFTTYVLLSNMNQSSELESKFPAFLEKRGINKVKLHLQPLTKIHLHSRLRSDLATNGELAHVYIFSITAVLLLLLACINFVNLETARSSTRQKEVAVRKVVGAFRLQLIRQFLLESTIMSLLAFLFSLALVEVLLPYFNSITGKDLNFSFFQDSQLILFLLICALVVGIVAGMYPAHIISAYQPESTLKGRFLRRKSNYAVVLRSALVILQFSASIVFLLSMFVIRDQLNFISNKNLGYNKEHLLKIPTYKVFRIYQEENIKLILQAFKSEIAQNANIKGAAFTDYMLDNFYAHQGVWWEGMAEEGLAMNVISVDYDFIDMMGIELKEGRNFSGQFTSDRDLAYILNEAALKVIGWRNAVGKRFLMEGANGRNKKGEIIGVVKNFHYRSLRQEIEPLVLIPNTDYSIMLIKIQNQNRFEILKFLESKWKVFFPNQPFEFSFFDDDFNRVYKNEIRMGKIFDSISALAMFIACLGILGLASFAAERRTKEIGIRKALGASVSGIIFMLLKELITLVVMANIIALPIGYYAMNKWLQNFAYKTNLSTWTFLFGGIIVLLIALATVSFHAIRAARANPVDSLRYE